MSGDVIASRSAGARWAETKASCTEEREESETPGRGTGIKIPEPSSPASLPNKLVLLSL